MSTPRFPNAIVTPKTRPLQMNEVVPNAPISASAIAVPTLLEERRRRQSRRAFRG